MLILEPWDIKSLDISGCAIYDNTSHVVKFLKSYSKLTKLDISTNQIQDLPNFIGLLIKIENLDFSDCRLDDYGAFYISTLIKTGNLKELHLRANQITSKGVNCIFKALDCDTKIKYLSLGYNKITDISCLANTLSKNKTLEVITLDCNQIEDVQQLSEVLKYENTDLYILNMQYNNITNDGLYQLIDMLDINSTIRWVDLKCNKINMDTIDYDRLNIIYADRICFHN